MRVARIGRHRRNARQRLNSKGVVIVNQEAGSREVSEITYRFRYDQTQKRFLYIGFDRIDRDRATADASTT